MSELDVALLEMQERMGNWLMARGVKVSGWIGWRDYLTLRQVVFGPRTNGYRRQRRRLGYRARPPAHARVPMVQR